MNQLKFEEFENMPSKFLDTVSEKEFFSELEQAPAAQKKHEPNPAPESKQNFFSEETAGPSFEGQNNSTNVKAGDIVSGELATELLNRILPVLLSLGVERFLGYKAPKKNFELTAAEKNTIAPIIDQCLSKLNINFENPFIALGLSMSFIYGSKIIDIANNPELQAQVKKSKEVVNKATAESIPRPAGSTRKPGETRGRKPKQIILNTY